VRQYIGISAGLLLLGLGTAGPAAGQAVYLRPPGFPNPALPAYEIMRVVSSHGLTPVTRPVRRGRNYVLLATDKSGQEMRIEVDARLGDIVGLRAPIRGEPYGPPIAAATSPPPATVGGVLPPRPIPNVPNSGVGAAAPVPAPVPANSDPAAAMPSAAPPPGRSAAVQPNLPPLPPPPPLPRPRPKLTAAETAPETSPDAAAKPRPPGVPAASQPHKETAGEIE